MVLEFGDEWTAWRVPPAGATTDIHNAVLERLRGCFGAEDAEVFKKLGALFVRDYTNREFLILSV
jgi:hypothetical protein